MLWSPRFPSRPGEAGGRSIGEAARSRVLDERGKREKRSATGSESKLKIGLLDMSVTQQRRMCPTSSSPMW